jgi:hypothetical protein
MSTNGDIDFWATQFPIEDISGILHLILNSWKTFKFTCEPLEVPITQRFCVHLRNNKDRSRDFFRIELESCDLDDKGDITGRIDLKFSQGLDEKVYFSFECKRLRVNFPRGFDILAGKYVTEGMFRYFNGQYARDLDKGGMLGYVMDGNCNEATRDVQKAIETHRSKLYMHASETLKASSCINSKQVKETVHKYGPSEKFILYHIFLPIL